MTVKHKLSKSEIRYSRLYGNKTDETQALYSSMPEYFRIHIQSRLLEQKRFKANKIYINEKIMEMFEIGDIIEITKDDDETIVVELVTTHDT